MEREGLKRILTILKEFKGVSGLKINVNKTQLIITGGDGEIIGDAIEGILVVNEINVLGIQIDRKLVNLDINWEKTILKMATYLMGSLPIGDGIINRMNEVIVDFVNGRERKIARERWFRTREMGGYGLTDMKIMNLCIKASWVRRWYLNKNIQDYPEVRILKGNRTEPDFINMDEINREGWKSLGEIMKKWIQYKSMFYKVGRNMLAAKVFNNEIQLEGGGTSTVKAFGRVREQELEVRLKLLNLQDCLGEDNMMKS